MKKYFIMIIVILVGFLNAVPVFAFPSLVPPECTGDAKLVNCDPNCEIGEGRGENCCCDLSSAQQLGFNLAQIILGISGAVALLMFVIGGVMYMTSQGNSSKVDKATGVLRYAVIGLAMILLSGAIIKIALKKITGAE